MKRSHGISLCSLAATGLFAPGFLLSTPAQAQNAAAAYDAYNSAFLVQANGQTYYANNVTSVSTGQNGEWTEALDIVVAEDRYQYTHAQSDRDLVIALLNSLAYYNAPKPSPNGNWQTDGYDDNLAWMVNAFLRGYQFTGVSTFLTQAEAGWNQEYKQGWDTTVADGGLWEDSVAKTDKCAVANNPFIFEGVGLYQATGDSTYLREAETVYSWMHSHLLVTTGQYAGQVHGCVNRSGAVEDPSTNDDDAFNDGAFLEAATELYRVTGNQSYYNDARLVADHTVGRVSVLNNNSEAPGSQWAYWFTRGLSDFATVANLWPNYESWLQGNANAAWSERDSLNLTWNDWTNPTQLSVTVNNVTTDADPMEMSSAAAIWQHLLPPSVNLSGTYEIQNVSSGLALNVSGGSTTQGAAIIQFPFSPGQTNALWKFVPTSSGYYEIQNVNSGQMVNVTGASGINGALILQWPAQNIFPGNDQWLPVENPNGTYSFYNLNSLQALDVPGGSTESKTQLDQWFGNNTVAQQFNLIPQS